LAYDFFLVSPGFLARMTTGTDKATTVVQVPPSIKMISVNLVTGLMLLLLGTIGVRASILCAIC